MTISPSLAAIASASLVAVVVAFVLRPAQLAPHPVPEPSAVREATDASPPPQRTQAVVYVAGAVVHPGVYTVAGDARARDALAKAGGGTRDADLVAVNLAARVSDGEEIAVPHEGEAPRSTPRSTPRRAPAGSGRSRRSPRRAPANAVAMSALSAVDLNSADAGTLAELPGIGPTLAERIVEFRTVNGPFTTVDELADVAGITPQRLDALTPLLTVGHN